MAAGAFLSDVRTLRERARRHIEQGAVTPSIQSKSKCQDRGDASWLWRPGR